jgi:hypothetical protein
MPADPEEKHVINVLPSTHMGKKIWILKIYYPNQKGVVKTVYAPEQEGIIDLTLEQAVEPTPEPVPEPVPTETVTENALPTQQ